MNPRGTHDATTPADIDEFRIVRMLGRGGMGAVYLAHDTILDRAVALKLVRAGTSEESRLRFLTEARAIARLDHPNIIGIFRAGTTGTGEPYLVQELVRGQSLDRMGLPFNERRCLELATAIARGLAAAHRHGVLHRDVKPSNIMIDEAGTPRLLDFGLAKLTGAVPIERPPISPRPGSPEVTDAVDVTAELPAEELASLPVEELATTETADGSLASPPSPTSIDGRGRAGLADRPIDHTSPGALLGTPRYMAPELWRAETATARSDLYSLGVVMYELRVGAPPYPQTDRASLERAVLEGPLARPIDACVPGIDPAFAALVTRCLARDPAERPESADEVVYQLERIAAGAPPMPEGNPYRGLAPFEAEQRALFFGRGPEISSIVDRLRTASLVVVAGDSGIGKSSLCRAGVVPAITGGALGDRRTWSSRTLTPGRDCIAALGDALGGLPAIGAQAAIAEGNQLPAALARHLSVPPDRGVVVFVDQLEELVTQNPPGLATRAAEILAALGAGVPGIKVILAVRGDYFTRVAALPGLRAVATRSLHLVRGLSPDDARDAVESPARAKGVQLETRAMVDALVASIVDRPAALPLLQFALSELWKRRDLERAVIPERALADIGGVSGALASYADQMLTALAAPERTAARRVLLALVTAEGTRASRVRSELVVAGDDATAAALEALVTGRLVVARDVADGAPVYELAHESLLTAWGTLRGWLDDAAGQRGIRTRLSAAADEWHRLGRSRELLWRRAQLAEAASLQDLTAGDRAFLRASRRNARLRIALAVALAAAIPAAAAMTWWRSAHHQQEQLEHQVAEELEPARHTMWIANVTAAGARQVQDEAIARFRTAAAPQWIPKQQLTTVLRKNPEAQLAARERRWDFASQLFAEARATMGTASRRLEAAVQIGARQDEVRRELAKSLYEQAVLADALGDDDEARELVQRLRSYDTGEYFARWHRPIAAAIQAETAIRIEIWAYRDEPDGATSVGREPISSAEGDHLTAALDPGSYRAALFANGVQAVYLPFVVRRGPPLSLRPTLPRPGEVPDGFVYIPAGAFLYGSNDHHAQNLVDHRRSFLRAAPLHEETTAPYLIGRNEVTFGEWLDYLRSLQVSDRKKRRQDDKIDDKSRTILRLDEVGDKYVLTLRTVNETLRAPEGEPLLYGHRMTRQSIRWERSPAAGVTLDDARAYAQWLSTTGKVPGARLCTSLEWERAARGADGRMYPHGDRMLPDDANLVETYGREYPGPDEVGSHDASASPFGIMDMSGNAFEWIEGGWDITLRGGGWFHSPPTALTMNITAGQRNRHEAYVGFRVCADAPAVTEAPRSSR